MRRHLLERASRKALQAIDVMGARGPQRALAALHQGAQAIQLRQLGRAQAEVQLAWVFEGGVGWAWGGGGGGGGVGGAPKRGPLEKPVGGSSLVSPLKWWVFLWVSKRRVPTQSWQHHWVFLKKKISAETVAFV